MAIVSIVGRPNVGKSSLFNRIIGERRAIVDDMPGVTRDRLYGCVQWKDKSFYVVDTGGLLLKDKDPIMEGMKDQIFQAIEESDVVIFLVDGSQGVTWMDEDVAQVLRSHSSMVVLAVNKIDDFSHEDDVVEAYSLGFERVVGVSALHDRGVDELLDQVVQTLGDKEDTQRPEEGVVSVALVGRPNVGKSSILNALTGSQRSLVSDIPGTTRDSIDAVIEYKGERFRIVDTAGLRRKSRVKDDIEFYSTVRTMDAVDQCDVAIFVMDARELATEQDQRLVGEILARGKGVVLVVNKWDLLPNTPETGDEVNRKLREEFRFVSHAPVLFTSAVSGRRLHRLLDLVSQVRKRRQSRFSTTILNRIIRDMLAFDRLPTDGTGRRLRIYYCTQSAAVPPTFVFFVNDPSIVTKNFENHLSRKIREAGDFDGVPLRLFWRSSHGNNEKA
ncbi:ribosome biogenesis GTPase Der [Pyramidobacter sp. SM-530-WT-4B]|uniref:GTPase Der n=1 Tax=Pyramidobacter porci TaxID=2605789 RepID=A0A6L5Y8C4_9BACT|nr:ribosome biogenesis GTPase Der [Pyramidobacter porci]MDY2647564.1 ribosome biogenesis GTPase Der [Pyramidobacter porci]MST54544.1 ribosome biogenesis GTPase Der [Pyramidobacter porci]